MNQGRQHATPVFYLLCISANFIPEAKVSRLSSVWSLSQHSAYSANILLCSRSSYVVISASRCFSSWHILTFSFRLLHLNPFWYFGFSMLSIIVSGILPPPCNKHQYHNRRPKSRRIFGSLLYCLYAVFCAGVEHFLILPSCWVSLYLTAFAV